MQTDKIHCKAFIFDLDGVIVNTEQTWARLEKGFLERLMGKEIAFHIQDTVGASVHMIYEEAVRHGFSMSYKDYCDAYNEVAYKVYDASTITPDVDVLLDYLKEQNCAVALVSASPMSWVDRALSKLSYKNPFPSILSVNDRLDLAQKPSPDGYKEMMKILGVSAEETVILEDSNRGIEAGLASGAFTIAFTANLIEGYKQIKADATAKTMQEVVKILTGLR